MCREARKLFYTTNTFSFEDNAAPQHFLKRVPADLIPHISNVHLEMRMEGHALQESSRTARWGTCLTDIIAKDLVGISSLYLTIYLTGFVTCWRESQAEYFTEIFQSLR